MLSALLIASCFALSMGQTTDCINTYNATLGEEPNDGGTCGITLLSLLSSSDSAAITAICQEGEDCNTRLENIISACGDTVSFRSTQSTALRSYIYMRKNYFCASLAT